MKEEPSDREKPEGRIAEHENQDACLVLKFVGQLWWLLRSSADPVQWAEERADEGELVDDRTRQLGDYLGYHAKAGGGCV